MRRASAVAWQDFAYSAYPYVPELSELAMDFGKRMAPSVKLGLGGRKFRLLASLIGWRLARRMQVKWQHRLQVK